MADPAVHPRHRGKVAWGTGEAPPGTFKGEIRFAAGHRHKGKSIKYCMLYSVHYVCISIIKYTGVPTSRE